MTGLLGTLANTALSATVNVALAPVSVPAYLAVTAAHLALRPLGDPLATMTGPAAVAAISAGRTAPTKVSVALIA